MLVEHLQNLGSQTFRNKEFYLLITTNYSKIVPHNLSDTSDHHQNKIVLKVKVNDLLTILKKFISF